MSTSLDVAPEFKLEKAQAQLDAIAFALAHPPTITESFEVHSTDSFEYVQSGSAIYITTFKGPMKIGPRQVSP